MAKANRKPVEMIRLVYTSKISRQLTPADLESIAEHSQKNNDALNLTGILLLRGQSFHAMLEGGATGLLRTMEKVIIDDRHFDIRILQEETITARRFANWSFAALPSASPSVAFLYPTEEFSEALSKRLR